MANVDYETESMINSVIFGEGSEHGSIKSQRPSQTAKPSMRKAKPARDTQSK